MLKIWKELKKDYGICLESFNHIRQWILEWIQNGKYFHSGIMVVAIWHACENRNLCRNGEALIHLVHVVGKIKAYVELINLHSFSSVISIGCETFNSNKK